MKSRSGFVSNSSTSSFIIAIRPDAEPCPTCGRKDLNLKSYFNEYSDDSITSYGADDAKKQIRDAYDPRDWEDDETIKQITTRRDDMLNMVEDILEHKSDWDIISCRVSHDNEMLTDVIYEMDSNGSAIIIEGKDD